MIRAALALLLLLCACQRLPVALKGGTASSTLGGFKQPATSPQTAATLAQPTNPAAPSLQTVERQETHQEAAPLPSVRTTETAYPTGIRTTITEQFGQPTILTNTVTEKTGTTLGAAQKDTSGEITAKLSSARPIQFAGFALLAFALACLHPGLRLIVGAGKTLPALCAAAGLLLIFGPSLFVGHESLALLLAVAGILVAFLLVRLSHKEGAQDATSRVVDNLVPFPPSSPPSRGG